MRDLIVLLTVCGLVLVSGAWAAGPPVDELFPHRHGDHVLFRIEAPMDAQVSLVGDFEAGFETEIPLDPVQDGIWQVELLLEPGEYGYQFLVDGFRVLDPSNPDEVVGDDGTPRSRILVLPDGRVSQRRHWVRRERRRRDDEDLFGRRHDFTLGGDLSFNRVDGTTLWLRAAYRSGHGFAPEFGARFGYGWESQRVNIEADFAQPILPDRVLFAGVRFEDGTGFENQAGVGSRENTLAAMLFKHDFNDYYEVMGIEPYLRLHLFRHATLRMSYASEDYNSVRAETQWSFFKARRDQFRPNPQLFLLGDATGFGGEGHLDATRVEFVLDTRRARQVGTIGFLTRGFLEIGHGDFDYGRWVADGRAYTRLGKLVHLAARLRGGARFDGRAIPSQKLFYVGGLGTVRGHPFRALTGDREILGNLEYTFLLDDAWNGGILLFYDAGTAWDSTQERLGDTVFLQALGFGFKSANDDFQIHFAKPIGELGGGIETTVRLNRTF